MAAPTGTKGTTGKRESAWPVTVGLYGALFLFGAVQGLIGSFQYSRAAGAVPVAALICCAAILATCLLAGPRGPAAGRGGRETDLFGIAP